MGSALDEDWPEVRGLCAEVRRDVPVIVPEIVTHIRAASPDYEHVPRADHEKHVGEQFRGLLDGLAARCPPTAAQTEAARELGRQRARQGVRVEEMIGAYHVGYREMWNALLARADEREPQIAAHLVRVVDLWWTWIRLISSASADAHAETLRSQHAVQITMTHRFLEILRAGEDPSGEAVHLARALTFDPDGSFQAVCFLLPSRPEDGLDQLRQRLRRLPGTIHSATRGTHGVVLCQAAAADLVTATVHEALPGEAVGIGLTRPGLAGAEASIVDAERALAVAGAGEAVLFGEEWLPATLLPHGPRLAPLLQTGSDVAADHPHLADAVLGYAECGFSITSAAKSLNLHPNSVKYRLDRWTQLTGWDPREVRGLLNSWITLRMRERSRTGRATR